MLRAGKWIVPVALAFLVAGALPGFGQDANSPADRQSTGWRRFDEAAQVPASLTLPAGTWVKVRIDQVIASDRNQVGDGFTATLAEPLVAGGLVVARRGQTIAGRVAEADKGGRVKGTSHLGLELDELGLVDGQQVPIHTRLIEYAAGTSRGRDATAVVAGAGVGAVIGAAAEGGGFGAGMGAIAGAAAATVGVLATRGKPTVVYPEALLTFRLEQPLTLSTSNSSQAFRPVAPADYQQQRTLRQTARATSPPPPHPYDYWDDWYMGGYYYPPYFYGPGIYFSTGPRFYGGGGGGFRGGGGGRHR
jgi:hypothetical protein